MLKKAFVIVIKQHVGKLWYVDKKLTQLVLTIVEDGYAGKVIK